jgi:hypothetical protein
MVYCIIAISDDFTTVSITCPCLGDPTDPTYNIGLHLYASQPSNSANVMSLVPATTSMQGNRRRLLHAHIYIYTMCIYFTMTIWLLHVCHCCVAV